MTLENVKILLLMNNREILNRMENLRQSLEALDSIDYNSILSNLQILLDSINDAKIEIEQLTKENSLITVNQRLDDIDSTIDYIQNTSLKDIDDKIKQNIDDIKDLNDKATNLITSFNAHVNDNDIHVTKTEKDLWNTNNHTHDNKDILDKFSISTDNNLLFDGNEIKGSSSNITISNENNNAIQTKDDGIFVEDKTNIIDNLSTRVNQINLAQKTINEPSYVSLLDSPASYTILLSSTFGTGRNTTIDQDIILNDDITKYSSIKIIYGPNSNGASYVPQMLEIIVENIKFNDSNTVNNTNNTSLYLVYNTYTGFAGAMGGNHITASGWFKQSNILRLNIITNPVNTTINNFTIFNIIGIKNEKITIDPLEHVNKETGVEDTPVGHIIAHMGNTPPKHYLKSEGSIYNITDYPYLAEHIKIEFGSYNYFGGDDITTFAVPDLQGEFLRGTGTNSHAGQGNGADVGVHQDGTEEPLLSIWAGDRLGISNNNSGTGLLLQKNADTMATNSTISRRFTNYNKTSELGNYTYFTSRPTNTSILYCIKYEPTYFMSNQIQNLNLQGFEDYSEEEIVIGKWIDGKPIYRKIYHLGDNISLSTSNLTTLSQVDIVNRIPINSNILLKDLSLDIDLIIPIEVRNDNNICKCRSSIAWSALTTRQLTLILEYIKTTDEKNSFKPEMLSNIIIPLNSGTNTSPEESLTDEEIEALLNN